MKQVFYVVRRQNLYAYYSNRKSAWVFSARLQETSFLESKQEAEQVAENYDGEALEITVQVPE